LGAYSGGKVVSQLDFPESATTIQNQENSNLTIFSIGNRNYKRVMVENLKRDSRLF